MAEQVEPLLAAAAPHRAAAPPPPADGHLRVRSSNDLGPRLRSCTESVRAPQYSTPLGDHDAGPAFRRGASVYTDVAEDRRVALEFANLALSFGKGAKEKRVLRNVTGRVRGGQLLAMLGPSGAGKTTLLMMLTLDSSIRAARKSGSVTVNGRPLSEPLFLRHCAVVEQEDTLWAFLTCREMLEGACALHGAPPGMVDELLAQTGLEDCQHTRAGNKFVKGLSGGQRRRLSLAIALAKQPQLLLLDEPTSGLDSAAAAAIMQLLSRLAHDSQIAVACTIHQPSAAVFAGFDQTLILASGRVAFLGRAAWRAGDRAGEEDMSEYLASIGVPVPGGVNPAEFVLDLVNKDFTPAEDVDKVLDAWEVSQAAGAGCASPLTRLRTRSGVLHAAGGRNAGFCAQVGVLLRRQLRLAVRDPTLYAGRFVVFIACCSFFAVMYIKARDRTQQQGVARIFCMMWCLGVPANLAVISCFAANDEARAVRREVRNGMYHPAAYLVAQTIFQIPLMVLLALAATSVAGFGIASWRPESFATILALWAACLWCYENIAQLCAYLFANPLLGMLIFLFFWFATFLYSGIMLDRNAIIWPFRAIVWISPMYYTLPAGIQAEYKGTSWDGAVLSSQSPLGFDCPEKLLHPGTPTACLGATGEQVLRSLHVQYEAITDDVDEVRNLCLVLAIAAGAKVIAMLLFIRSCRAGAPPAPLLPSRSAGTVQVDAL